MDLPVSHLGFTRNHTSWSSCWPAIGRAWGRGFSHVLTNFYSLWLVHVRGHGSSQERSRNSHPFLLPKLDPSKLRQATSASVAGDACHLRWSWNHWSRCGKKPWPTRWRRGTRESGGWSSSSANVQPAFWIQNANHRHAKKKSLWTTSWWSGSKQWLSTFSLNMGTSFCKLSDTWKAGWIVRS